MVGGAEYSVNYGGEYQGVTISKIEIQSSLNVVGDKKITITKVESSGNVEMGGGGFVIDELILDNVKIQIHKHL